MKRLVSVAPLALVGCSLLGLGDYPITECTFDPSGLVDSCSALCPGGKCTGCSVPQCDTRTKRCVYGPKDTDHDGDADPSCGGGDCNDHNADVSSKHGESLCDGLDNDCNGLIDEGLVGADYAHSATLLTDTGPDGTIVRARTSAVVTDVSMLTSAPCIVAATDGALSSSSACVPFIVDTGRPVQPYSRFFTGTFPPTLASVYTRADTCNALALRTTLGVGLETPCSDGPHSRPTIAWISDQMGGKNAILTYFASAPSPMDCNALAPSPLRFAQVLGVGTTAPTFFDQPRTLTTSSRSLRAAAVAGVDEGFRTMVAIAAPDDANGVSFWLVDQSNGPTVVSAPIAVPLMGARSVDLEVAVAFNETVFGVVAEIGCPPGQTIALVTGSLGYGPSGERPASIGNVVTVGTGGSVVAAPTVTFVGAPYYEWRVSWIADAGDVAVQRVLYSGALVGAPIVFNDVTKGETIAFAGYGSQGNVIYVGAAAVSVPIGCVH